MTDLEKAARAMWEWAERDEIMAPTDFRDLPADRRDAVTLYARAALRAIREPSPEVVEAMIRFPVGEYGLLKDEARGVWRAAIDAITGEKPND